MTRSNKFLIQTALAVLVGAAALAATTTTASAAVVCNRAECWHTTSRYDYRPAWGLTIHDDNWRWGTNDHYRWREHAGRGYWRNNVWVTF